MLIFTKKKGFTIAEILMTMAILGFVVALSVPMLGQQKIKKTKNEVLVHGLFECYYDNAGLLTQHLIDEDGKETVKHVQGSCSFTPPFANFYAITSAGAGGDGGFLNKTPSYTIPTKLPTKSINISTNENFQSDLQSLSDEFNWVRTYWDDAAIYNLVNYTINGRIGKGGWSNRVLTVKTTAQDQDCSACLTTNAMNCPEQCYKCTTCKGGDSIGYNYFIRRLPLTSDLNITYDFKYKDGGRSATALTIGDGRAIVYDAPAGSNAKGDIDINHNKSSCIQGNDGYAPQPKNTGFGFCKSCYFTKETVTNLGGIGVQGHPTYNPKNGDQERLPGISSNPPYITAYYQYMSIKPQYGTYGEAGNVITRTYEQLPITELTIIPAANANEDTVVYMLNSKNEIKYLSKTNSGANGRDITNSNNFAIETNDDLPVPTGLKSLVINPSKNTISSSNRAKKSKIDDLTIPPAIPGSGAYPLVTSINASKLARKIGEWTAPSSSANMTTTNPKCLNGDTPEGSGSSLYCKATQGGKGAVIIEW